MPGDENRPRPGRGTTILLARHGETEWNRIGRWQGATDIPLSDVGRAQARALASALGGRGIRRVYASHLARARETAEIVAALCGIAGPVTIDPRLRERGYGCFEGLTREECAERHPGAWQRYLADRRTVPPDAEPQTEIIARVTSAMRDIAVEALAGEASHAVPAVGDDADRAGASALVISHGGSIRSFVHAELGILLSPLGNGSVLRLRFEDGSFALMGREDAGG